MVKCHFTSVLYSSLFYSISAAAALDKSAAAQLDLRCGASCRLCPVAFPAGSRLCSNIYHSTVASESKAQLKMVWSEVSMSRSGT